MTLPRLQIPNLNDPHTAENILAKLNSDINDAERKSYIKILLDAPNTFILLPLVSLQWETSLLEQQIEMEMIKEKIRMKKCFIAAYKDGNTFDAVKKNESMQASINEDLLKLCEAKGAYEQSMEFAKKSLALLGPFLEEVKAEHKASFKL